MTANNAAYQVIAMPVRSDNGVSYVLLFENRYQTALQVYGLLPGYTTICISGVVTLFLAVLVVLPIRRLRKFMRLTGIKTESENNINVSAFNGILGRIFGAESWVLRRMNLPFGVSGLCVARAADQ